MPQVNRLKDFVERVGWTFIYAAAAAAITALTTPDISWKDGLKLVGIAGALAALKVIAAQQVGTRGSGDAIPGGVEA